MVTCKPLYPDLSWPSWPSCSDFYFVGTNFLTNSVFYAILIKCGRKTEQDGQDVQDGQDKERLQVANSGVCIHPR